MTTALNAIHERTAREHQRKALIERVKSMAALKGNQIDAAGIELMHAAEVAGVPQGLAHQFAVAGVDHAWLLQVESGNDEARAIALHQVSQQEKKLRIALGSS